MPSNASAPRPIASIARIMRPSRPSMRSAISTIRRFGRRRRRPRPQGRREFLLVALGRQRANGHKGGRRRPGNAGIAVNHERMAAIPVRQPVEIGRKMRFAGGRHAGQGFDDVVHGEEQVVVAANGRRQPHGSSRIDQGDDAPGTAAGDGLLQSRQGTNVDHQRRTSGGRTIAARRTIVFNPALAASQSISRCRNAEK